jgi:hypothetical protein
MNQKRLSTRPLSRQLRAARFEVLDRWLEFQEALSSEKRKYPIRQFQAFGP